MSWVLRKCLLYLKFRFPPGCSMIRIFKILLPDVFFILVYSNATTHDLFVIRLRLHLRRRMWHVTNPAGRFIFPCAKNQTRMVTEVEIRTTHYNVTLFLCFMSLSVHVHIMIIGVFRQNTGHKQKTVTGTCDKNNSGYVFIYCRLLCLSRSFTE